MPSIPQSLLWISLVVLWLFVLVPMLINKRDAVRRTSDVALATRVLTSGAGARLIKRGGPAAGHRSDPDWRREDDVDADADLDADADPESDSESDSEFDEPDVEAAPVVKAAAVTAQAEFDYLDVDIVEEDSGALPAAAAAEAADHEAADDAAEPVLEGAEDAVESEDLDDVEDLDDLEAEYQTDDVDDVEEAGEPEAEFEDGEYSDEYEYVEDTAGLEAEDEPATAASSAGSAAPAGARRNRYDSKVAEAVSARKYAFRKRVLMTMAVIMVVSAAVAFTAVSSAWWLCAATAAVTVLYLGYLRRQTRIEQQVRARRMQRMARSRLGVENVRDSELDVVPSRLSRPGAAVLEIDDEDPAFEHLEYAAAAREHDWRHDLPRAAGQ